MTVLIVTMPGDHHALSVKWAIEKKGGRCEIFYPLDLTALAEWTLRYPVAGIDLSYFGRSASLSFDSFDSIWMRRPAQIFPAPEITDQLERSTAEIERGILARSIYHLLTADRFTVNPIDAARSAALKPYQFAKAVAAGLKVAPTIVSNSKAEVALFIAESTGGTVFKPLHTTSWLKDSPQGKRRRMVPTTLITQHLLDSAQMDLAPGIFQSCITKKAEVRATIMGRSVFAWKKTFDGRDDLDVDWRLMFKDAREEQCELPVALKKKCFRLMDDLGLVFGCFDFAVDLDDEYVFLEVNPQGQWLWGDMSVPGLNQLEGMAEFLMSKDRNFRHSGAGGLSVQEYYHEAEGTPSTIEDEKHFGRLTRFKFQSVSFDTNPSRPIETSSEPSPEIVSGGAR